MLWRGQIQLLTFGRLQAWIFLSIAGVDDSSACSSYGEFCNCERVTSSNVCEVTQDKWRGSPFVIVHGGPVLISASVVAPNISITAESLHMQGGGCLNTSSQAFHLPSFYQLPCLPHYYGCPIPGDVSVTNSGGSGAGHGGLGWIGDLNGGINIF